MSASNWSRVAELSLTLDLLRDRQPRTRQQLARITGQTRSTVASRVEQLLSTGLVTPTQDALSTSGRPRTTFTFNPAARVVLAVDLGATHARVAVTDLATSVLAEHAEPLSIADGPGPVLDRVLALGTELLARSGRSVSELAGVGIGLPGPVDHRSGRPTSPPIMPGWDDADVAGRVRSWHDVPVLVDNDVNIMALGAHATQFPDVDHLLFVKVATGIGAGVVSDGDLRRGAQGAAGDLGHIAVPGREHQPCRCGNAGCLEAVVDGRALAGELTARGIPATSCEDVVTLVRSGDVTACQLVREAGRCLGEVLAACVSLLNPSVIVVGGRLSEAGDHLLAGIRENVYRRSLPLATQHLRIVTCESGGRAGVVGASSMVVEHVLSIEAIEAFL